MMDSIDPTRPANDDAAPCTLTDEEVTRIFTDYPEDRGPPDVAAWLGCSILAWVLFIALGKLILQLAGWW